MDVHGALTVGLPLSEDASRFLNEHRQHALVEPNEIATPCDFHALLPQSTKAPCIVPLIAQGFGLYFRLHSKGELQLNAT